MWGGGDDKALLSNTTRKYSGQQNSDVWLIEANLSSQGAAANTEDPRCKPYRFMG